MINDKVVFMDKVILELTANQIIQHFMEEDRVHNIKVYSKLMKESFQAEVTTEKGKKTLLELHAREWQILTHRSLLEADKEFPSRPFLLRSHAFVIKLQEKGYALSLVSRALVGGGNGSSRFGAEKIASQDWEKRIAFELEQIPSIAFPSTRRTPEQQKQLNKKLLKAVKAKNYDKVFDCLNQGASPNNYIEVIVNGEPRRQSTFCEAISRRCPVSIINLLTTRFDHHKDQFGNPVLKQLIEAGEEYLSTIKILLQLGETPDETYTSQKTYDSPQEEGNVYITALKEKNFPAAQLLIRYYSFNASKGYLDSTLFLETFRSGGNHEESMAYQALAKLMLVEKSIAFLNVNSFENPLIRCAIEGWAEVGKLLLEKGLQPSARKSLTDMSALQLSIFHGSEELAHLLVSQGADVNYSTWENPDLQRVETFDPFVEAQNRGWTDLANLIAKKRAPVL